MQRFDGKQEKNIIYTDVAVPFKANFSIHRPYIHG